jgi:hypothetical protein
MWRTQEARADMRSAAPGHPTVMLLFSQLNVYCVVSKHVSVAAVG